MPGHFGAIFDGNQLSFVRLTDAEVAAQLRGNAEAQRAAADRRLEELDMGLRELQADFPAIRYLTEPLIQKIAQLLARKNT